MSAPVTEERTWTKEQLNALSWREIQAVAMVCVSPLLLDLPRAPWGLPPYIHVGYDRLILHPETTY